ncbi:Putative restriction endonuclease [Sphingomonas palmae]|uniref:Putative restriction endonuclease n=1 Tax=Sphingomonas palmae TaxID=1855283 RepID=A0A1H7U7Q0_9SPHN|nr:Uma2 family endonuclease [Sphingomonas palmae]SEL93032.1 Putative restriction endonuclease [Sphingomonas palmae]
MTEHVPITNVPTRVKLRVEDYLSLDRDGAFDGYGKTELIDGEVTYMNAQHRPHARVKMGLYDAFKDALPRSGEQLGIMVEASIAVPPNNVPEPDITLTSEPDGSGLIPLNSVRLVVEVADTTLRSDLTLKATVYARHGVAEYWVADVNGRVLHQMWSPENDYRERRLITFGDAITAATIANLTITTDHL